MTKKGEFCHALKRESNFQPEKEGKKLASKKFSIIKFQPVSNHRKKHKQPETLPLLILDDKKSEFCHTLKRRFKIFSQ